MPPASKNFELPEYLPMSKSKTTFAVGILFSQLLFFGCAKEEHSRNDWQQDAQPHYLDSIPQGDASAQSETKRIAMSGRVDCANSSDCSPAVGMLVSLTADHRIGQCSAFLISPQIAITNSHCIPTDLKSAGANCSDRIWLYFPELNGSPQVRMGCSQVLIASSLPEKTKAVPDYAVLKLDQAVNRPPLEVSRDGFKDESSYQIEKVDPQSTTYPVGAITRSTCKAVHNSAIVRNSNDNESANMALGDCQIIHGNSGSPLLDSSGKAVGVIQLTFEQNTLGSVLLQLTLPMLDPSIGPLSAGTSFACLDLPSQVAAAPLPPQCSAIASRSNADSDQAQNQSLIGKIDQALADELKTMSGELNSAFQWAAAQYKSTQPCPRF